MHEAGEQVIQGVLTASEQRMYMFALGHAGSRLGMLRQSVTVQHHHPLEIVRNHARSCESSYPGSDNDGLFPDTTRHGSLLDECSALTSGMRIPCTRRCLKVGN